MSMGKVNKWKFIIPLALLFVASVVISTSGCSRNQNTSNSDQAKNSPASLKPVHNTVATPPNQMRMFDEQNGYGWSADCPVMVTSNGGATWTNVTPQISGNGSGKIYPGAIYFVDAQTGWAFKLQPENSVAIYSTQDNGQSWSQLAIVPVKYGDGGVPIAFSDARHGWFADLSVGNAQLDGELFATSDGGKTWQRMAVSDQQGSLPFGGGLTAQNDATI